MNERVEQMDAVCIFRCDCGWAGVDRNTTDTPPYCVPRESNPSRPASCKTCQGTGETTDRPDPILRAMQIPMACPDCHGTGRAKKCETCGSTLPEIRDLIPAIAPCPDKFHDTPKARNEGERALTAEFSYCPECGYIEADKPTQHEQGFRCPNKAMGYDAHIESRLVRVKVPIPKARNDLPESKGGVWVSDDEMRVLQYVTNNVIEEKEERVIEAIVERWQPALTRPKPPTENHHPLCRIFQGCNCGGKKRCETCDGEGSIPAPPGSTTLREVCPDCSGTGESGASA